MSPPGFTDDEVRLAMRDIFGDDGGVAADGGTDGAASFASGANTSFNGANQQDGFSQRFFSPDGVNAQGQIVAGILADPTAANTPPNGQTLAGEIAGKIWDLPNTALGLGAGALAGLATLATGQVPHLGFGNGAIQISNLKNLHSLNLGGALTLGDVQLYNGVKPDTEIGPSRSPYIQPDGSHLYGFTYGQHEGSHTIVDDRLGPFALPLYLFSAARNGWLTNPYEQKADEHAAYGTSPFP